MSKRATRLERHELMDRASLILGMFDLYIAHAPALKKEESLHAPAKKAVRALYEFYQAAGAVALGEKRAK